MNNYDENDQPFKYEPIDINPKEISKITHEINNVYHSKYYNKRTAIHRSLDLSGNYCIYFFENHGFDNYNIFGKYQD